MAPLPAPALQGLASSSSKSRSRNSLTSPWPRKSLTKLTATSCRHSAVVVSSRRVTRCTWPSWWGEAPRRDGLRETNALAESRRKVGALAGLCTDPSPGAPTSPPGTGAGPGAGSIGRAAPSRPAASPAAAASPGCLGACRSTGWVGGRRDGCRDGEVLHQAGGGPTAWESLARQVGLPCTYPPLPDKGTSKSCPSKRDDASQEQSPPQRHCGPWDHPWYPPTTPC